MGALASPAVVLADESVPGAVRCIKKVVPHSAFVDIGGGIFAASAIYTLQDGDILMATAMRVTEDFDATGASVLLLEDSPGYNNDSSGTYAVTKAAPSHNFVSLAAPGSSTPLTLKDWDQNIGSPVMTDSGPAEMGVILGGASDNGTQGSVTVFFFVCTPASS